MPWKFNLKLKDKKLNFVLKSFWFFVCVCLVTSLSTRKLGKSRRGCHRYSTRRRMLEVPSADYVTWYVIRTIVWNHMHGVLKFKNKSSDKMIIRSSPRVKPCVKNELLLKILLNVIVNVNMREKNRLLISIGWNLVLKPKVRHFSMFFFCTYKLHSLSCYQKKLK